MQFDAVFVTGLDSMFWAVCNISSVKSTGVYPHVEIIIICFSSHCTCSHTHISLGEIQLSNKNSIHAAQNHDNPTTMIVSMGLFSLYYLIGYNYTCLTAFKRLSVVLKPTNLFKIVLCVVLTKDKERFFTAYSQEW